MKSGASIVFYVSLLDTNDERGRERSSRVRWVVLPLHGWLHVEAAVIPVPPGKTSTTPPSQPQQCARVLENTEDGLTEDGLSSCVASSWEVGP